MYPTCFIHWNASLIILVALIIYYNFPPFSSVQFSVHRHNLLCSVLCRSQSSVGPHVLSLQPLWVEFPPRKKILRSVRGGRGEECHRCSGLGSAVPHTTFLIYLLAVVSLHCRRWALSCCSERGLLFLVLCGLLIAVAALVRLTGSRCAGFSICCSWALECWLSCCGARV